MLKLLKFHFVLLVFCSTAQAQSIAQAGQLLSSGNFRGAEQTCRELLVKNPKNTDALDLLGDIYARQNKWQDALVQYSKLKSITPGVAQSQYKYGGALGMVARDSNKFKALGMIGDIREAFEKAIAIDPNHVEARWALIELNLQLPAIVGGSEDQAQRYATQLLRISPVDGYLARGHIAEYYQRFSVAEQHYRSAITIGKSKTTYQKLADLYKNKMNQPDKAAKVMQQYLKTQSSKT